MLFAHSVPAFELLVIPVLAILWMPNDKDLEFLFSFVGNYRQHGVFCWIIILDVGT